MIPTYSQLVAKRIAATMTSRELAAIADKRHDNVMRVCRDLRDSGVCPQIEETPYIEPSNEQTYTECQLNQRDSYVAMARLSPEFTARLVDRWQELEARNTPVALPALPKTFAEALRALADKSEESERQAAELALAAPKVKFVDRYVTADTGAKGFRQVCKLLKANEARFREFLAGAHAMDEHFRTAPLAQNLPVRLGLLDLWYRNFHGFSSRSIAPYHSALRRVPAYLQQLEMESNGKRVNAQGEALPYATSPTLWGEPGTNGQHAFFQMLHQGTDVVPMEFVAVKKSRHTLEGHHTLLLANVLAQAQALMQGKVDAGGHKHFTGNRPSTFLLLEELTPASLGAFIALQEHRVFVSGSVWGINSFDQWGVELGKVLAKDIHARIVSGDASGLDASTAALLQRVRG